MNVKIKGYALGAIAAATYGTNPLFALPLYADGMSADVVLFLRYLIALPPIAMMLKLRGHTLRTSSRGFMLMSLMGVLMALSSLLLFESYRLMDAGIASTLLFVYPLMVAILMAIFHKEPLRPLTMACIAAVLAGIALLMKGSGGTTLSTAGTAMVMVSALTYSIYIISVSGKSLRPIPTFKVIFYVLVAGACLFGCKIAVTTGFGTAQIPSHWYSWGAIAALALLPTVISFLCTTAAVQYIGPTPTAILGALEPATAVLIGVTVFNETVTPRNWLGLVMIVVAVSLVIGEKSISRQLVHIRKLFPKLRPFRTPRR